MSPWSAPRSATRERLGGFVRLAHPAACSMAAFMPAMALGPHAFQIDRDVPFGTVALGQAFALFFLASAVVAAVMRTSSIDHAFRVRAAMFVSAAASLGLAMSGATWMIMALSVVAGAANGVSAPSLNLMVLSQVPPERHGLAFGLRTGAPPAAAAVAAMVAGVGELAGVGWRPAFVGYAVAAAALAACRPYSREPGGRVATHDGDETSEAPPWCGTLMVAAAFLASAGSGVLGPFLSEGLIASGESAAYAAVLVSASGWLGLVTRVGAGMIADRFGSTRVALHVTVVTFAVEAVSFAVFALEPGRVVLAVAVLLGYSVGWSWSGPLHHATLALTRTDVDRTAGSLQASLFMGSVVGPLGFGYVAHYYSFSAAWSVCALTCLLATICAVMVDVRTRSGRLDAGATGGRRVDP